VPLSFPVAVRKKRRKGGENLQLFSYKAGGGGGGTLRGKGDMRLRDGVTKRRKGLRRLLFFISSKVGGKGGGIEGLRQFFRWHIWWRW